VTVEVLVPAADDMRALGTRLGDVLKAGDLVLLSGALGSGKTTLAQGLGDGLGVRGPVTSPTFVIARVNPSTVGGPPMVHVDAYRLTGWDELEDLDLEASLDDAVTVVEWGSGLAEGLAEDRLELTIVRAGTTMAEPSGADGPRRVVVRGCGRRWAGVDLGVLRARSTGV
jgi:tRNA threonylcarbamoyladenosine biosynthesis protein TsaE